MSKNFLESRPIAEKGPMSQMAGFPFEIGCDTLIKELIGDGSPQILLDTVFDGSDSLLVASAQDNMP